MFAPVLKAPAPMQNPDVMKAVHTALSKKPATLSKPKPRPRRAAAVKAMTIIKLLQQVERTSPSRKRKRPSAELTTRHDKKSKVGEPEAVFFIGNDGHEDWWEVKWIGSEKITRALASNFPPVFDSILLKAKARGSGENVPWTSCAGNASTARSLAPDTVMREGVCFKHSLPKILFRHSSQYCALYSLLNVVLASKKKAKKARAYALPLGGFRELAGSRVPGIFKVRLRKVLERNVRHLLKQKKGKYLLRKAVHCVSVDCDKQLLYDSAREYALPLTANNLQLCGFFGDLDDLRLLY